MTEAHPYADMAAAWDTRPWVPRGRSIAFPSNADQAATGKGPYFVVNGCDDTATIPLDTAANTTRRGPAAVVDDSDRSGLEIVTDPAMARTRANHSLPPSFS